MSITLDSQDISKPSGAVAAVDVARPQQAIPMVEAMQQMAAAAGTGYLGVVRDFARLAMGPGRLSFAEYVALRLFDAQRYAGIDKKAFVGLAVSRKIWTQVNFRLDLHGIAANKIASSALLGAYGLPTIPVLAVYSDRIGMASDRMLRGADALRAFLRDPGHYPLFGKPTDSLQSLGSASLDRIDTGANELVAFGGRRIPLDAFVAEIGTHYGAGYLFQRRVSPHRDVRALCGDRLATVRVLTIVSAGVPKILRACWKIPAGANAADNFWRSGNILARLDLQSGRILSAVRGTGIDYAEPTHHPDTGAALVGATVPNWRAVTELALEAAKVVPDLALIGWDIAPVDDGAVLVESNEIPDFILPQMADGRGILDDEFKSFLAERKALAKAWDRNQRQGMQRSALSGFNLGAGDTAAT